MNYQTDSQLLRAYAERRSESAFAELVRRHVDLVYSAAVRMVCDSHLAEDVTQAAFVALAKNSTQLTDRPVLSSWLHRTAQNIAAQSVRTDVRRRAREQEAAAMNTLLSADSDASWEEIAPHLDAALGELTEPDRDALLLRYFERKSASEMAEVLGVSDEAAQKRVSRAVERLREIFNKRGISTGASGLVLVISTNAVQAAPVGLAITICTSATLAGAITTATLATQATMNWINLKSIAALVAAALAAGTGTYLVQQREATRLHDENQGLIAKQEELSKERDSALAASKVNEDELERLRRNQSELLRLRGEVGALRRHLNELDKIHAENRQPRAEIASSPYQATSLPTQAEYEHQLSRTVSMMKWIGLEVRTYSGDHQGQYPTNFDQLIEVPNTAFPGGKGLEDFEFVNAGLVGTNTLDKVMVRQRIPFRTPDGRWSRVYGFADGAVWTEDSVDGNFFAYEKQHMVAVPP